MVEEWARWLVPKPLAMKSVIACRELVFDSRLYRCPKSPSSRYEKFHLYPSVAMAFARDKLITRSPSSAAAITDIGKITFNEKCHVHPSQSRDVGRKRGDSCTWSFL